MFESRMYLMPTVIHFGCNSSAMAGPEALRMGAGRALLVTDASLLKAGTAEPVLESLSSSGIGVSIYDQVITEPTLFNVDNGLVQLRREECDLIVAVGGGSCIDTAKAISIMSANPGQFGDYRGFDRFPSPGMPVMAVPTTAGTGSETTCLSVITDTERNIKMSIGSPHLMPRVALVDPLLTLGMPQRLTAGTGVDALTHAIEAYVSVKAQPMSDVMALSAIELIAGYLPRAWSNPDDLEARTYVLLGAFQAGSAFSNASVGLVHGMARPLGAYFHVPHGLSNAALLATIMQFCLEGNPERYARIARAMGVDTADLSPIDAARLGAVRVKELVASLGIPSLSGLGVEKESLLANARAMADDAIMSGAAANSPRVAVIDEIVSLYMEAF
ncbi:MAG: iron-containing alcohol dehydrogenase [Syntrophobacteraceae bacterium]